MTFADDQIVYRGFDTPEWGEYRLIVGGVDVTYFRGVWAQIGTYSSEDPYGPSAADFRFPQINMLEAWPLGLPNVGMTGDLAWCNVDVPARLVQVRDGVVINDHVWVGFLDTPDVGPEGVTWHCGGELQGTAELDYKPAEVFPFKKDVGRLAYEIVKRTGVKQGPHNGLATGIILNERGRAAGTGLACLDYILSEGEDDEGRQLTILPNSNGKYVHQWRDTTTVHATVWADAHGVTLDLTAEPLDNTFYAQGRNNDGGLWMNAKAINLIQGPIPVFPGTISDPNEDTGDGEALRLMLQATGYLDGPNDNAVPAVKALQRDAGLTRTGTVNAKTWKALYSVSLKNPSLKWAQVLPLFQDERVAKFLRTASGAPYAASPTYEPGRRKRARQIDFGVCGKAHARRWLENRYDRDQALPNFSGTITLTTDVAVGDVEWDDEFDGMSRLDLKGGMNIRLRNFGDMLFHVGAATVTNPEDSSQPVQVVLSVDTKARNMLELSQILERNRAAKERPDRGTRRNRRRGHGNEAIGEWSAEIGGILGVDVPLKKGWNKRIPIPAGQSGTLQSVHFVMDQDARFAIALWNRPKTIGDCRRIIGNPLAEGNKWWKRQVADEEKRKGSLVEAWGTFGNPCGYSPGQKRDEDGPTGDPVTGRFHEASGVVYYTSRHEDTDGNYDSGVLYANVYVDRDCTLKAGRVLKVNLDPGVN